jgi:hypothetical protein
MWLDPALDHPTTPTPDPGVMLPGFRWNEIRASSGADGGGGFWDDLRSEKCEPTSTTGTSYGSPAVNDRTGVRACSPPPGRTSSSSTMSRSTTGWPSNQVRLLPQLPAAGTQ